MDRIKRKKILIGIFVTVSLAVLILTQVVLAADSYRINNGVETKVDEHGVCRMVDNNCGKDIFVPTKTSTEWGNFRSNYPTGITLSNCSECSTVADCNSLYHSCLLNGNMMDCFSGYCCCETAEGPCGAECPYVPCPF